ncbi:MAG: acyltransferase [Ilumatobacteraceae bacterium]
MTADGRIRQQPGLEGLRGLAVAAVVIFHIGRGWLPGGYLGVSLFFTISGVVIGSVLLAEIERTGRMAVGGFFVRRARRLYPAAWLVLATVAVLRVTTTTLSSTSAADIVTSWLQVANWHFLYQGTSYADLFDGPSAVLHFWSLAIEEQLYLVIGVGTAIVARSSPRPARTLGLLAGCGALASFALPFVLSLDVDHTYYGTGTRAGEVFVGLVVAAVISDRARRVWLLERIRPVIVLGMVALAATFVAWCTIPAGSSAINSGLLPVTALASCAIILAALMPRGPVAMIASTPAARWLGGISYGLYLVHFPVFVIVGQLDPDAGLVAVAAMVAVAVGLAVLVARWVEWPVRAGRVDQRRLVVLGGALTLVGIAALAVPARTSEADDLLARLSEGAPADGDDAEAAPSPSGGAPPPSGSVPADPSAPTTVAWYGDSVALSLLFATSTYVTDGPVRFGDLGTMVGCGVALSPQTELERCVDERQRVLAIGPDGDESVAIVMSCQWELLPVALPGTDVVRAPDDAEYDAFVRAAYVAAADRLRASGFERVLWVLCPHQSLTVTPDDLTEEFREARDPARVDHLNALVRGIADTRDDVTVVDLPSWVDPRVDDADIRPDGSHYEWERDTGVSTALAGLVDEALRQPG